MTSPKGRFETTNWTLVGHARDGDTVLQGAALQQLLEAYVPALTAHLVYDKRLDPNRASDLVQGFVLKHVLEGDVVDRAQREGGRFRTWLLRWLENYVRNESRRHRREKTMDVEEEAPSTVENDAKAFDVAWAHSVLAETLNTMQLECRRQGHDERWQVFQQRVIQPCLTGADARDYDEMAHELGIEKEQAQNALVTAKRQFQRILRTVIGCYEQSGEDVESEIAELRRVLATSSQIDLRPPREHSIAESDIHALIDAAASRSAEFFDLDCGQVWRRCLATPLGELLDESPETTDVATLGELLADPRPPLAVLVRAKEFGNRCIYQESGNLPQEVGLAIYLACISAAQTRLDERITSSPAVALKPAFELLFEAEWLPSDTIELLREGVVCLKLDKP